VGATAGLDVLGDVDQADLLARRHAALVEVEAVFALGVVTVDASSTVQYANDAIEGLFGYSPEELVGESLAAVIPDRFEAAHFEAIDRYVETGEKRLDWEWLELPARHRNGEEFPVGVSFGEYTIDSEPLFTGIIRDITDRKEREAALERSEDLLDRTQRLTNVGGWELDLATDEQRWTDEVYRIHGLPVGDEPDLESALDFYHPEDRPVVERAIESGEGYDEELRLLTANDEQRWVRTQGEPHFEDGEITKIRGAFQDITEQKFQQRELRSTNSTLSTLLGNVPVGVLAEDSAREVLFANDAFCRLFGVDAPPDALVGSDCRAAAENVADLFVDADRFLATNDDYAEGGETVTGEVFERSGTPIPAEEAGDRYLWVYHDVTERVRREAVLETLHDRTRAMMTAETRREVCEIAVETAREALGMDINGIWLFDEGNDEEEPALRPAASSQQAQELFETIPTYRPGNSLSWAVFSAGETRFYRDIDGRGTYNDDTPIRAHPRPTGTIGERSRTRRYGRRRRVRPGNVRDAPGGAGR
jgi:PAS domain S-box-containing protein